MDAAVSANCWVDAGVSTGRLHIYIYIYIYILDNVQHEYCIIGRGNKRGMPELFVVQGTPLVQSCSTCGLWSSCLRCSSFATDSQTFIGSPLRAVPTTVACIGFLSVVSTWISPVAVPLPCGLDGAAKLATFWLQLGEGLKLARL